MISVWTTIEAQAFIQTAAFISGSTVKKKRRDEKKSCAVVIKRSPPSNPRALHNGAWRPVLMGNMDHYLRDEVALGEKCS